MTDSKTVDLDAALAEILFTPEGKADPVSALRRDPRAGAVFRRTIGTVVVARYDDCRRCCGTPGSARVGTSLRGSDTG